MRTLKRCLWLFAAWLILSIAITQIWFPPEEPAALLSSGLSRGLRSSLARKEYIDGCDCCQPDCVPFCACQCVPQTLYATIAANCACANTEVVTLVYDPAAIWSGSPVEAYVGTATICGQSWRFLLRCPPGEVLELELDCDNDTFSEASGSTALPGGIHECDPFYSEFVLTGSALGSICGCTDEPFEITVAVTE